MISLIIFLIPFAIGILLTQSDEKIGPIPIKLLGYILAAVFGLFTLLLLL